MKQVFYRVKGKLMEGAIEAGFHKVWDKAIRIRAQKMLTGESQLVSN